MTNKETKTTTNPEYEKNYVSVVLQGGGLKANIVISLELAGRLIRLADNDAQLRGYRLKKWGKRFIKKPLEQDNQN